MTSTELAGNLLEVLNDDCIYLILERLSLEDLCVFGRTCKHMQALCDNQFRRKYQHKATEMVDVWIRNGGKLRVDEHYVKYFDNFIKNVTIIASEFKQNEELAVSRAAFFVKRKCDQNLHKICIGGDFEVTPSLCKEIENFLRNVEVVEFIFSNRSGTDVAKFLEYCSNLTKLIFHLGHVDMVDAILQQKYHRLTHFYCLNVVVMNLNAEKLKIFFQTNEQIQCVALSYGSGRDSDRVRNHAVKCIQTFEDALNLQHLLLSIDGGECFDDICSLLNVMCARENFKTLELRFFGGGGVEALKLHAKQLAKWKQFTKIHLYKIRFLDVIPALRLLAHLKIVVFQWLKAECNWDNFNELSASAEMALPQIEEVQFEYVGNEDTSSTYVMQIVRHWTNLKKISVPTSYRFNVKFDLVELNRAREKLKNSTSLTIFTDYAGNPTNLDHKLVQLHLAKFKSNGECPFQQYFMESGQ